MAFAAVRPVDDDAIRMERCPAPSGAISQARAAAISANDRVSRAGLIRRAWIAPSAEPTTTAVRRVCAAWRSWNVDSAAATSRTCRWARRRSTSVRSDVTPGGAVPRSSSVAAAYAATVCIVHKPTSVIVKMPPSAS